MYSEGSRTWPIFGEGGLRDVCLEKITFQWSSEWLRGSQIKEKDEGRTFWAENEIVLFLTRIFHVLILEAIKCGLLSDQWQTVGAEGRGSWGRGLSYSDCLAYFHANHNDVLSWFHSMNILLSPDPRQSKLEGNFEVIWGSEITNCKKTVLRGGGSFYPLVMSAYSSLLERDPISGK